MKILLATPPFSEEERYGALASVGTLYPPLGLAYIAGVAEQEGHTVKVVEAEGLGLSYDQITREIAAFSPDLVGMPTFLNTINRCYEVARAAKQVCPGARVVLGGVQVTLRPDDAMAVPEIDFVVRGEGEEVFRGLLRAMQSGSGLSGIAGLVWRRNAEVVHNPDQPLIRDLDILPKPARHLFPMHVYHASSQLRGKRTLHLMSSRGCPFRCSYCTSHLTFGKTFRYHSPARIIEEMLELKESYGADGIQFYDETFTLDKNRVHALCDELRSQKIRIPWACFTRVNVVDKPLLEAMSKAGCYQIFYGVEAAEQRLLDLIKKDITIEQIRQAFRWTREAGMEALASFMIGLPTETLAESYKTIDFAIEINADYAQWQKTTPFPGTELYDICRQHGDILTTDWTKFTAWNEIVYVTRGRTKEDIIRVEKDAFRKFYLRPGYIISHLSMFLKLSPSSIGGMIKAMAKMLGRA